MENKCNSCFYALMDKDLQTPCITCTGYSNFVNGRLYMTDHLPATLKEAIDDWFHEGAPMKYDTVSKPKHYMLFEDEGIEVRDVIEKLVEKVDEACMPYSPLFSADYVQMMQYLMRFMDKNGVEDLKKARWYLDKMIEAYGHA
jgi:hypothetical protein